jgi:hypothetical protein
MRMMSTAIVSAVFGAALFAAGAFATKSEESELWETARVRVVS